MSSKDVSAQKKGFGKILTVPNLLSCFRIALIPLFVYFFFSETENRLLKAAAVFALSGVTDVADGFIARKFAMVSDLGKILDPIADKLTQATVVLCLAFEFPVMIALAVLLLVKESLMLAGALLMVGAGERPAEAKWWGKMATVVLFVTVILFLADGVFPFLPKAAKVGSVLLCGIAILFSLFNYYPLFKETLKKSPVRTDGSGSSNPSGS